MSVSGFGLLQLGFPSCLALGPRIGWKRCGEKEDAERVLNESQTRTLGTGAPHCLCGGSAGGSGPSRAHLRCARRGSAKGLSGCTRGTRVSCSMTRSPLNSLRARQGNGEVPTAVAERCGEADELRAQHRVAVFTPSCWGTCFGSSLRERWCNISVKLSGKRAPFQYALLTRAGSEAHPCHAHGSRGGPADDCAQYGWGWRR